MRSSQSVTIETKKEGMLADYSNPRVYIIGDRHAGLWHLTLGHVTNTFR